MKLETNTQDRVWKHTNACPKCGKQKTKRNKLCYKCRLQKGEVKYGVKEELHYCQNRECKTRFKQHKLSKMEIVGDYLYCKRCANEK